MQLLPEATTGTSPAACGKELLESVPVVMRFIRRNMREHRADLSVPQFRALCLVDRQPSASLSAVAEHLASSLPTASRIVTGLVSQGLLKRDSARDDRRQVSLSITPSGKAVMAAARHATQTRLAREMDRLSPAERSIVKQGMEILKTAFAARDGRPAATSGQASAPSSRLRSTPPNGD